MAGSVHPRITLSAPLRDEKSAKVLVATFQVLVLRLPGLLAYRQLRFAAGFNLVGVWMEMQKNSGSETSCETICEVGKRQVFVWLRDG